ncbi:MAG: hypothetical protein ACOC45_03095 [Alkalispirochaetaceae bacterium]
MVKILGSVLFVSAVVLLTAGCAGAPESAPPPESEEQEVYFGEGRSESLARAMSAAKMDAVRNAVIDMIGPDREEQNRQTLEEELYNTRNPNLFVYPETMETLRNENVGSVEQLDFVYEVRIRVNRPAIETVLRQAGVTGGGATAEENAGDRAEDLVEEANRDTPSPGASAEAPEAPEELSPQEGDFAEATPEQERFIRRYVDTMTYMVYADEESAEAESFLMRSAVGQANAYLTSQGMVAIDYRQVESLQRDQEIVYEEETGREMSMIQWVAQRLNADVYIELDASTESETNGSNHYATATVTLRMFDSSTAQLLGSVNRRSQRTLSRVSQEDAVLNALQSTVYQAMPVAIEQSEVQMARNLARGVRFVVTLQNTPDARLISGFRRQLRRSVSDVITVSQTAEQTQYEIYFYGRGDELEDTIYDVADRVPGFESLFLVLTRGNTLTFDTGL